MFNCHCISHYTVACNLTLKELKVTDSVVYCNCSDVVLRMKHPASKWQKLSIRNTRIMRAIYFSIENLPFLLITHACTFMLGAATYVAFVLIRLGGR